VNGKFLVYFEKEQHKIIDYNVGQVTLIRCDDITIKNQNLSDTTVGVQLLNTMNCKISDNEISNNNFGIFLDNKDTYLKQSSNNIITNNNISNNDWIGLYALYTSNNQILYNTVNKNNYYGIWFEESTSNKITNNICTSNRIDGIGLLIKTSGNDCEKNICSYNENLRITIL
jgi:parallel beta-helix repeat protein